MVQIITALILALALAGTLYSIYPLFVRLSLHIKKEAYAKSQKDADVLFKSVNHSKSFRNSILLSVLSGVTFSYILNDVLLGVIAGLLCLFLPSIVAKSKLRKRKAALEAQLPELAERMASILKAGAGLNGAFEQAAVRCGTPFSDEALHTIREVQLGMSLDEALTRMAARISSQDVSIFTASISIAQKSGGNISEILENIASSLRERRALDGKIKAMTAQGRMQGMIIALLPVVMLFAIYFLDREMVMPLFNTTAGQLMLAAGGVLEIMGLVAIRKIVEIRY